VTLQETLDQSAKVLDSIEGGLAQKLRDFQSTMNVLTDQTNGATGRVDDQVAALRELSSTLHHDVGAMAARLEQQSEHLTKAASTLGDTQGHVDKALEERRATLEALVTIAGSKVEAMETLMQSFANVVEEKLANAEVKARQTSSLLADNANTTAQAIADQFELIRTTTGKERERTSSALQSAYEQAVSEISSLFGTATARFAEVAKEMHGMTLTVQQELEATRSELKRGLLEIPKETSDSTATMRRVVAEQIQALNDLSDIVTRSGRSLDVMEPSARSEAAPSRPKEATITVPSEPSEPAAEPVEMPRAAQLPVLAAIEPRPARPLAAAHPAPAPARGSERRGTGWLSAVLARASRDEEEESSSEDNGVPALMASSLDTLSVDIAKMIEHDAASDIWERYRRGERNVFSRRLYTLQGQQAFEEIRRRYRRDKEFNATVDRYIQEFEQLIAEVDHEDRTGNMAKTYLTADSGKVYTILAHAAGKLA
jgi:hypothetical protein